MKNLIFAAITIFTTTVFAVTDAEIARWGDEVLAEKAKTVTVQPGQARIISVFVKLMNGDEIKIPGRIYWEVACQNMNNVKYSCRLTLETTPKIGEKGFGRTTMKSCYLGNIARVCDLVKQEAATVEGDGSFGNIQCQRNDNALAVNYSTDDYYGNIKNSNLTIEPCLK